VMLQEAKGGRSSFVTLLVMLVYSWVTSLVKHSKVVFKIGSVEAWHGIVNIWQVIGHIFGWQIFNGIFSPHLILLVRFTKNCFMVRNCWSTGSPQNWNSFLVDWFDIESVLELIRSSSVLMLSLKVMHIFRLKVLISFNIA
jgi:hypothetical protein